MAIKLEETAFKHGATEFPLTTSLTKSLLADLDPAVYYAMGFFAAMIEYHLGVRFVAQAAAAGIVLSKAVGSTIPYDPEPHLLDESLQFPVFALYRSSDIHDDRTIQLRETKSTWGIDYVLPPLNAAQAEVLVPMLNGIGRVIDYVTTEGGDNNYQNNLRIWEQCEATWVRLASGHFGRWQPKANLVFHGWHGEIEVSENRGYVSTAFAPLEGIALDVELQVDGTTVTP